jgi:ATP-dependent DNA helicase RecG
MFQSSSLVYADEIPVDGATEHDIDLEHLKRFHEAFYKVELEKELEKSGISLNQLLCNLMLAKGNNLNLAGLLLFGDKPQRYKPMFSVKVISFVGNDPAVTLYRDSADIEGCLRDMYKGTISFLTRNLKAVQNGKGFNTQGDLEIPLSALEELVVNMLVHRDYFISAPCRVMIFDNRVELVSPGALPNSITIQNIIKGVSVSRNPIIVSFATKDDELPYRGLGTGILRALADIPDLELESDTERNLFIVRIPRK